MTCATAQNLLQPYLDGGLERQERTALESHVAHCAACRLELVRLERLMLAIEGLPRFAAPPILLQRTMAGVARAQRRRTWAYRFRGATLSGAVALLSAGIVLITAAFDNLRDVLSALFDMDSPAALFDALVAMAASMEAPVVIGVALAFIAGCVALVQLVQPEVEASTI